MAKARIKHEGKTYEIELDGKYTEHEQELLEKLGIIEKPKKKKKYKNVENKKPSYEEVEKQELDEYLNEKQDGEA